MTRNGLLRAAGMAAVIGILVAGCGGGGEATQAQSGGSAPTLVWDTPGKFADGVSLDARRDLDHYEIFLRTDPDFNDNDLPVDQVTAISEVSSPDGNTNGRKPTTEYPLDRLFPYTQPGKRYYVSIKAVGVDGLKSGFMPPVEWNLS